MPQAFHITFPFEVVERRYRPGIHAPLCTHPIPLAFTIAYHRPTLSDFRFVRQYYANTLLTVDLLEGKCPDPFTLIIHQQNTPTYVFAVMLEGSARYDHKGSQKSETLLPGTVYFARLCATAYPIRLLENTCRMLFIAVHAAQLAVIGEDFDELADLLGGSALSVGDHFSPPIQADSVFMRRLIRLISPEGIKRRKDFNEHLQQRLSGVCSAIKGLLRGKGQHHYDDETLEKVLAHISEHEYLHGQPPTLRAVLKHARASADKLEQLFGEKLGTTPSAYLLGRRMEAVRKRLLQTDDPVYKVAMDFGYSDAAALNKPFKRHFGISPGQLRRQYRNG
ncbi:helix-turn-helix transcriptional regulator [Parapedobacter koreensis]|uniref:AraC-type DNA-binding protein n=1 Tax=Parapedobacter koreensis TaxID=332977 RepID=A0A1H7SDU5_9SPHI|nr:AraC family transcriptional regulator [Parapedobacter koreensis]SEL70366.1 AraC-type DNA-binding protein [Parapedobacter koreensis]